MKYRQIKDKVHSICAYGLSSTAKGTVCATDGFFSFTVNLVFDWCYTLIKCQCYIAILKIQVYLSHCVIATKCIWLVV